jgi:NAD(P)-dependent dehydrogenase (short-subunit alcohol dehydrogenase family)
MTPSSLEGKVAVVVGAGSIGEGWGNGKASAVSYARAGARVVCVDFHLDRAEATRALIEEEGGAAVAIAADATSEADVAAAVSLATSTWGRLDVMHNNVGVGGTSGGPDKIAPEQWDREIAQNLTTAYLGIRCVVPVMQAQGGGVITNISSLMSTRFLRRPSVAYTASKAAVEALTRSCAAAYGRDNIRVNCIRIGFSETPLITLPLEWAGLSEEQQQAEMDKSRRKVPLRGEHGDGFDVGNAAVFLASDEAKYISGAILNVDGALEAAPI